MKNGSDYLTNIDLIKYMAKNFKNIILSTGMSYEEDIDIAIKSIKSLKKIIISYFSTAQVFTQQKKKALT